MPTRPRTLPASLIARLANGDRTVVPRAADLLAAAASTKSAPRKSLAKALQHLARSSVSAETCALVEEAALPLLPSPTPAGGPRNGQEGTCDTEEAAALAGIPADTLVKLLHDPRYRHAFGWPMWLGQGRGWSFVRAAVEPATSRTYLATVPNTEPPAIAATLPPWCRREVPAAVAAAPSSEAAACSTAPCEPDVPPLSATVYPATA